MRRIQESQADPSQDTVPVLDTAEAEDLTASSTSTSRRRFLAGVGITLAAPATLATSLQAEEASPEHTFLTAVQSGPIARVRGLLDAHPELLKARDAEGRSAFLVARLAQQEEIAALLLERGHTLDLAETVLVADWDQFKELVLAAPETVNHDFAIGGTPMYAAALAGVGSDIWRVYQYGGDPNVDPRGSRGMTPVRMALEYPDLAVAEITAASLLSNGAAPNGLQPDGSSPLHAAAARGSLELVEMLIRKGAQINAKDSSGRSPLELAVENKHRKVVDLLENPSRVPRDRSTSRRRYDFDGKPFQPAELSGFPAHVKNQFVGAAHFNLEAVREQVGQHPELAKAAATTTEISVEACAHTGRKPVVDFLLDHGAPYSLPTAVMRGDADRARALLKEDPLRIHERGAHDFALLWYPVIGDGLLELTELLLAAGAEVEKQHFLGTTALHYAAIGGQKEMIALLLENGADPNRVGRKFDAAGQTPRQIAEARGHSEVVQLLKEKGG